MTTNNTTTTNNNTWDTLRDLRRTRCPYCDGPKNSEEDSCRWESCEIASKLTTTTTARRTSREYLSYVVETLDTQSASSTNAWTLVATFDTFEDAHEEVRDSKLNDWKDRTYRIQECIRTLIAIL